MSIIAKLSVNSRADFSTGSFVQLSCVASNEVMAAYAGSEEDRLFSRYSPSGEIRLHQAAGWAVFENPQAAYVERDPTQPWVPPMFYVMLLSLDEVGEQPSFGANTTYTQVECYGVSKYAYDGVRVELRDVRGWRDPEKLDKAHWRDRGGVIEKLSWTMHVDNPAAEGQFVSGRKYWVAFYPVSEFDRDAAIRAAHGHPDPAPEVTAE
jgi:hypothetical protein